MLESAMGEKAIRGHVCEKMHPRRLLIFLDGLDSLYQSSQGFQGLLFKWLKVLEEIPWVYFQV
jgi:hypothetical protein